MHLPRLNFIAPAMLQILCAAVHAAPATEPAQLDFGTYCVPPIQPELENETSPRTVQLLGETLSRSGAVAVRARLLRDLGECHSAAGRPFVERAIADAEPAVREQAARAAGEIASPAVLPALRKLLTDSVPSVRREAVLTGAALHDMSFVRQGANDPDASVAAAAAAVCGETEVDILNQLARHDSAAVRVAAADALAKFPKRVESEALSALLQAGPAEKCA